MKKLVLVLLVIVLAGALVFGGCTGKAPEANTIKVGVIWGLTGPGSQAQIGLRDATLLCADWINEKGGVTVNGKKYLIECIVEDNKNSPAGSVAAATKLVHQDQVKFIVGCFIPVQVDAITSITEPNKVLFSAAITDVVHADRPYSFAASYSYAAPLPGLYGVLPELYPGAKTVGYIVEDETGARAVGALSQNIARAHGLNVLEPQVHPWEAPEYYPEWTKMIAEKPDVVDIGLKTPDSAAACVRHGRELGFKGPMFAAMPGDPHMILGMIGNPEFATDFIWPTYDSSSPEASPMVKEIIQLWGNTYNYPFDVDSTNSWDSLWCLVQAIEKAQSLDPTEVAKAWESMETIQSAKGTARMGGAQTFGINHMVFAPCPISRLKNGEIEFIKWFDPWMP